MGQTDMSLDVVKIEKSFYKTQSDFIDAHYLVKANMKYHIGTMGEKRVFIKEAQSDYNQALIDIEALRAAHVDHPNIVKLIMKDSSGRLIYEFVEGVPLTKIDRKLSVEIKEEIYRQIIEITEYLHDVFCYNFDLSPNNLLVDDNNNVMFVDLADDSEIDEKNM